MNRRVGKTLFLIVMFILVLLIADRIHPGSHKTAGALLGFVGLAAFFGGRLSALLDRLFLRQMLGARIGLLVSCVAIWLLVLAYLLTLRPDGVEEHSPSCNNRNERSVLGSASSAGAGRSAKLMSAFHPLQTLAVYLFSSA